MKFFQPSEKLATVQEKKKAGPVPCRSCLFNKDTQWHMFLNGWIVLYRNVYMMATILLPTPHWEDTHESSIRK
jgi:hypothetical protein